MRHSFVDDATVTAVEMQPGELTELSKPSLPAAITVAMPTVLKVSIASLSGSVSQWAKNWPPPRLMLTASML